MITIGQVQLNDFPLLLAPMEDVSDPPFRAVCKQYGADMLYTEFISSEGLIRDARESVQKLDIYDHERPIGIQIFGGEMHAMRRSAEIVSMANPDLLDINYGCPVKKVVCKMAGAGILQNIPLMMQLTQNVINATSLPVTVKTRLGWDENSINIEQVAEQLQDIGVKALSIHARTRKQLYKGTADWTWIGKVKNNPRIHIPIFGNGDINSPEKALEMKNLYGVDGIMIGRAAIGYPWIFREIKHFLKTGEKLPPPTLAERIEALTLHFQKSIEWKGEKRGIFEMRMHYGNYFKGFPDIKSFRTRLVNANYIPEVIETLNDIVKTYDGFIPLAHHTNKESDIAINHQIAMM